MLSIKKFIITVIIGFLLISTSISQITSSMSGGSGGDGDESPIILPPKLAYKPTGWNFGNLDNGDIENTTFQIWNDRYDSDPLDNLYFDDLDWELIIPEDYIGILTVAPSSGICGPAVYNKRTNSYDIYKTNVTVTVDTNSIENGTYACNIHIDCIRPDFTLENGEDGMFIVSFVVGNSSPYLDIMSPYLCLNPEKPASTRNKPDPANYDFELVGKSDNYNTFFEIWNCGIETLYYDLNVSCYQKRIINVGWDKDTDEQITIIVWDKISSDLVSVSPMNGSSTGEKDKISVTFDTTQLNYGEYKIEIEIISNTLYHNPYLFNMEFEVGYKLSINPSSKIFNEDIFRGDIINATFQVWNEKPGEMFWQIYIPPCYEYINVTPMSGFSSGPDDKTNVTVTIDTTVNYTTSGFLKPRSDLYFNRTELYAARPGDHTGEFADSIYIMGYPPSYNNPLRNTTIYPNSLPRYVYWYGEEFEVNYYLSELDPSENYDMLIITTDYLLNHPYAVCMNDLYDLKQAHEELDGLSVKIMTVEEIYKKYLNADPLYTEIEAPSNNKQSRLIKIVKSTDIDQNNKAIKAFIEDANKQWNSTYVLLAGDDNWEIEEYYSGPNYPDTHFGNLWEQYMENIDTEWLKIDNIEDVGSHRGGSVEIPTFQMPIGGSGSYSISGGREQSENSIIEELDNGWETHLIGLYEFNFSGAITIKILPLYPYNWTEKKWNKSTNDYDKIEHLRDAYVDSISVIEYYLDEIKKIASDMIISSDVVDLGTTGPFFVNSQDGIVYSEYTEDEIAHNAQGWNLSIGSYMNKTCRKINYKDNPDGGLVTMTNFSADAHAINITIWNDINKDGFDTFIAYVKDANHGFTEVYRNQDSFEGYSIDSEFTAASDEPYSLSGKVYVGRAPVSRVAQLDNFVRKTIEYMNAPVEDEYLNAILLSEYLGVKSELCPGGQGYKLIPIFTEQHKRDTVGRIIDPFLPGGYAQSDVFNLIEMHDTPNYDDELFPGLGPSYVWDKEELMALINQGVGIVNHIGRGDRYEAYCTVGWDRYTGYPISEMVTRYTNMRLRDMDLEEYTIHNVNDGTTRKAGLKNTIYPIMLSSGCHGGSFDFPGGSMAEFMIGDDNGAVAGVWCSAAMTENVAGFGLYDQMFWNEIFKNDVSIGEALQKAREDVATSDSKRINSETKKVLKYGFNLFGDPTLKVKGVEPYEIPPIAKDNYINISKNSEDNVVDVLANDFLPEAAGPILNIEPGREQRTEDNLDPANIDFGLIGKSVYNTSFEIWNYGKDTLDYSFDVECQKKHDISGRWYNNSGTWEWIPACWVWDTVSSSDWIYVTPTSGSSTGEKDIITITLDTTGLTNFNSNGEYKFTILISCNSYNLDLDFFILKFEVGNDPVANPQPIYGPTNFGDTMYEISIDSVTNPSHGNAIIKGDKVEYTPDLGYSGPDSFNYTILAVRDLLENDQRTSTATVFVNVSGVNDPPVVGDISDQTITMGDSFDLIFLDDYVSDLDDIDDDIVWSFSGNSVLNVTILGTGAGDPPSNVRFAQITAPDGWIGNETITFTATDSGGLSDSDTATFTVLKLGDNCPPVFSDETPFDGLFDVLISLDTLSVLISDPEGDNFSWSIETSPNIGSASGSDDSDGVKTCSITSLEYNTTYIWYVNATDPSGSMLFTRMVYTFTTEENNSEDSDDSYTTVEIVKPLENMLYTQNKLKRAFFTTMIIGKIDIMANVTDTSGDVASIKFFLDEDELKNITYDNQTTTYSYTLDKRAIGVYTLKVSACGTNNDIISSKEIDVIIFFFNFGK